MNIHIEELENDAKDERAYANYFAASYEKRKIDLLAASTKFKNNQTNQNYELCRAAYTWANEGDCNAVASWMNTNDLEKELFDLTGKTIISPEKPQELESREKYYFWPKFGLNKI
jgi:hypothetical protein